MITLKQINYALAVEKTLHFKKAAEACSVSQSALSTALTEMEKQLGIQVFERDNKKVLVTPLGKQFLEKARLIKLQVDDLYQLIHVHKEPLSTPMTVGVIPTIGPYLLPKVLPDLRKSYPDFKLQLVEEQSNVLVDMLRQGEIDSAILALPFPIQGLLSFEFWQEDFYWITHKDELKKQQQEITSDELDLDKLMLLKDGHCLKEHALAACKLQEEESNNTFKATSLNTLIQMVAGKIGTTLIPEMALSQVLKQNKELRALHLNEKHPHRSIAFITRPNFVGVNNIHIIMDIFKHALERDREKRKH